MANNHTVILKVRPQLVRKRTVVKTTQQSVKIVIKPSSGQSANLNDLNNRHIQVNLQQSPQVPSGAAVSKQHLVRKNNVTKKVPKVRYVSRDISQDSLAKIKKLKNHGRGKILAIIGNGPSINEIPLELLKHSHIHTLSINKPDARIWPTTIWAFFDQSQMRRHEDLWNGYNGLIINSTGIKRQKENSLQVKNLGGRGFSRDLSKGLHIGRSSVFAAMQVGYWMNYDHIYIFGCDMNPAGLNGQLHFYGVNPDVNPDVRRERFRKEAEYYDYAADVLNESERHKFTFCSSENPWEFVNRFNKLDHKIAILTVVAHADRLQSVIQ